MGVLELFKRWFGWNQAERLEEKAQAAADLAAEDVSDHKETMTKLGQRNWGVSKAIPDDAFSRLVQRHLEKNGQLSSARFRVENKLHG
jgi:hypothetical protein